MNQFICWVNLLLITYFDFINLIFLGNAKFHKCFCPSTTFFFSKHIQYICFHVHFLTLIMCINVSTMVLR